MITMSDEFIPVLVKGITLYPNNPLQFDFIVDTGDTDLEGEELKTESSKLIKYFLASLTVPEEELWVNLSPYEKDRIIPEGLGITEMGKDLLAQDYILKQLTASLIYPENDLGKEFWARVYKKAQEKYGSTNIPINTFNKVWILPDRAVVYEHEGSAFVVERHLKVMLEEDYLSLQNNLGNEKLGTHQLKETDVKNLSNISGEVVREVLIPEIEKEVNEGKNFANLRQIYNSMILATWYKKNLKESLLGQVYMDQNKTKGVDVDDKLIKQKIYDQYIAAFKQGVYNYIKEDVDPLTQDLIPKKYFSGGAMGVWAEQLIELQGSLENQPPRVVQAVTKPRGKHRKITWEALDVGTNARPEVVDELAKVFRGPAMRLSGLGLDENQEKLVDDTIATYFEGERLKSGRLLLPRDEEYQLLDPDGALRDNGVKIYLLPGLINKILQLADQRKILNPPIDLISHPGPTRRNIYIDPAYFESILKLQPKIWLSQWAVHELAHIEHPEAEEKEILKMAPIPGVTLAEEKPERLKSKEERKKQKEFKKPIFKRPVTLKSSIRELDFGLFPNIARPVYASLEEAGIKTVGDFRNWTEEDLSKLKYIKGRVVKRIKDTLLREVKVKLKGEEEKKAKPVTKKKKEEKTVKEEGPITLKSSIRRLNLGKRPFSDKVFKALESSGIFTIKDLKNKSVEELFKIKWIGTDVVLRIKTELVRTVGENLKGEVWPEVKPAVKKEKKIDLTVTTETEGFSDVYGKSYLQGNSGVSFTKVQLRELMGRWSEKVPSKASVAPISSRMTMGLFNIGLLERLGNGTPGRPYQYRLVSWLREKALKLDNIEEWLSSQDPRLIENELQKAHVRYRNIPKVQSLVKKWERDVKKGKAPAKKEVAAARIFGRVPGYTIYDALLDIMYLEKELSGKKGKAPRVSEKQAVDLKLTTETEGFKDVIGKSDLQKKPGVTFNKRQLMQFWGRWSNVKKVPGKEGTAWRVLMGLYSIGLLEGKKTDKDSKISQEFRLVSWLREKALRVKDIEEWLISQDPELIEGELKKGHIQYRDYKRVRKIIQQWQKDVKQGKIPKRKEIPEVKRMGRVPGYTIYHALLDIMSLEKELSKKGKAPAMRWSGLEMDEGQEKLVDDAVASYFEGEKLMEGRLILPRDEEFKVLDPEGVLRDNGVKIYFLPNLIGKITQLASDRKINNPPIDLVSHPGRTRRNIYIDSAYYDSVLKNQSKIWRTQWVAHELAHIENPEAEEMTIRKIAPLPTGEKVAKEAPVKPEKKKAEKKIEKPEKREEEKEKVVKEEGLITLKSSIRRLDFGLLPNIAGPVYDSLEEAGIKTVEDLTQWSEEDLLKLKYIKASVLQRIKDTLWKEVKKRLKGEEEKKAKPEKKKKEEKPIVEEGPITLESSIRRLNLGKKPFVLKVYKALESAEIKTIEDLKNKSENELLKIKWIGKGVVARIKSELLSTVGETLKGEEVKEPPEPMAKKGEKKEEKPPKKEKPIDLTVTTETQGFQDIFGNPNLQGKPGVTFTKIQLQDLMGRWSNKVPSKASVAPISSRMTMGLYNVGLLERRGNGTSRSPHEYRLVNWLREKGLKLDDIEGWLNSQDPDLMEKELGKAHVQYDDLPKVQELVRAWRVQVDSGKAVEKKEREPVKKFGRMAGYTIFHALIDIMSLEKELSKQKAEAPSKEAGPKVEKKPKEKEKIAKPGTTLPENVLKALPFFEKILKNQVTEIPPEQIPIMREVYKDILQTFSNINGDPEAWLKAQFKVEEDNLAILIWIYNKKPKIVQFFLKALEGREEAKRKKPIKKEEVPKPETKPFYREKGVQQFLASPSSKFILIFNQSGSKRIIDLKTAEDTGIQIEEKDGPKALDAVFSPEDQYLVVWYEYGPARIWDLEKKQERTDISIGTNEVSPKLIPVLEQRYGRGTEAFKRQLRNAKGVKAAKFSLEGRRLYIQYANSFAKVFDVETGQVLGPETKTHERAMFSRDGTLLKVWPKPKKGERRGISKPNVIDIKTGEFKGDPGNAFDYDEEENPRFVHQVHVYPRFYDLPRKPIFLKVSPNGRWVLYSDGQTYLQIYEVATKRLLPITFSKNIIDGKREFQVEPTFTEDNKLLLSLRQFRERISGKPDRWARLDSLLIDLENPTDIKELPRKAWISSDGKKIFVVTNIEHVESGPQLPRHRLLEALELNDTGVAFRDDVKLELPQFTSNSKKLIVYFEDQGLDVIDLAVAEPKVIKEEILPEPAKAKGIKEIDLDEFLKKIEGTPNDIPYKVLDWITEQKTPLRFEDPPRAPPVFEALSIYDIPGKGSRSLEKLLEDSKFHKRIGEHFIYQRDDGSYLVIRFLKEGEDPGRLLYESKWFDYLQELKDRGIKLNGSYPKAVLLDNERVVRLSPQKLPERLADNIQFFKDESVQLHSREEGDTSGISIYTLMAYKIRDLDYVIPLPDAKPIDQSIRINLHDLSLLLRLGLVNPEIINLLSRSRINGGVHESFLWMAEILHDAEWNKRAERHKLFELESSIIQVKMKASGPGNFAGMVKINDLIELKPPLVDFKQLETYSADDRTKLLSVYFVGNYLIASILSEAKSLREEFKLNENSPDHMTKFAERLKSIYTNAYVSFNNKPIPTKIFSLINWQELARQIAQFMTDKSPEAVKHQRLPSEFLKANYIFTAFMVEDFAMTHGKRDQAMLTGIDLESAKEQVSSILSEFNNWAQSFRGEYDPVKLFSEIRAQMTTSQALAAFIKQNLEKLFQIRKELTDKKELDSLKSSVLRQTISKLDTLLYQLTGEPAFVSFEGFLEAFRDKKSPFFTLKPETRLTITTQDTREYKFAFRQFDNNFVPNAIYGTKGETVYNNHYGPKGEVIIRDYITSIKVGMVDQAIVTRKEQPPTPGTFTKGGIDLNPELLDLQIKRDGKGVPLPLLQQPIQDMKIEGFLPIIINVAPVNLPLLLGVAEPGKKKEDKEAAPTPLDSDLGYTSPRGVDLVNKRSKNFYAKKLSLVLP